MSDGSHPGLSRRHVIGGLGAGLVLGGGQLAAAFQPGTPPTTAPSPPASGLPVVGTIEPNTLKRRGVGFRGADPARAAGGLTLFAPTTGGGMVYLIDDQGTPVHTWKMPYPPGLYGYLTDRGTLIYNGKVPDATFLGKQAGKGGALLEATWDGTILWEVRRPDHHHDGRLLPNGNLLLLCWTELPRDIANRVRGGLPGTEDQGRIYADYLVEMTTGGETVWEWRSWEHLDPDTHPFTLPSDERAIWTHGNAVSVLPDGNILLSLRNISTIVRINRQTGAIEWELGPPPLSGAHGVTPLANGNLLIFDNGPYRVDQGKIYTGPAPFIPFSRVIEVDPTNMQIAWEYRDAVPYFFFSAAISNAQRLSNGNTLVNEGLLGRFFEVTPEGDTVWEYVNPYFGPPTAAPKAQTNQVFRAYRYTAEEIAAMQAQK